MGKKEKARKLLITFIDLKNCSKNATEEPLFKFPSPNSELPPNVLNKEKYTQYQSPRSVMVCLYIYHQLLSDQTVGVLKE